MVPYNSVHFVGILTPEMANLALYVAGLGCKVSGSDDHTDTFLAPRLEAAGITVYDMFAQANIGKSTEAVVLSPFYDQRHSEAETAAKQKLPIITATEFKKTLIDSFKKTIVLDSYYSPLITAWMSHVWNQGYLPSRSISSAFTTQGEAVISHQDGDWFLLPLTGFKRDGSTYEAEFLSYQPDMVVVPAIYYDYPELYTTLDEVYQAYYTFVKRVPRKGLIIGNGDFPRMKRLRTHLADRHIETYGFDRDAHWHIRDVTHDGGTTSFHLAHDRQLLGPFTVPYQGKIYVYAAAAVCVASLLMDMNPTTLGRGLATVPRLHRYFEVKTDNVGRTLIDDQADHPLMIEEVLTAVRHHYPDKKIWCLYQPESYLRTKALLPDLRDALKASDFVYITDIKGYPKEKSEGLNSRHVVAELKSVHSQTYYFDESTDMTGLLRDRVATTDCIVTLGASGRLQEITAPLFA